MQHRFGSSLLITANILLELRCLMATESAVVNLLLFICNNFTAWLGADIPMEINQLCGTYGFTPNSGTNLILVNGAVYNKF